MLSVTGYSSMPPAPTSTVTMRDVAQAAGVSVATVSRFYNASGPVGKSTSARIEKVAQGLRYVPNAAARSLTTQRTHGIGVLLPDLYGEFFSELLRGLDRAARAHDLHLLVAGAHGDADELAQAARALHGRVDGLIIMSPEADADLLRQRLSPRLQLVFLGGPHATLAVDNRGGAEAATRHLIALGHRRIAHLGGSLGNLDAQERRVGYDAILAEAGLDPVHYPGDFREQAGHAAVEILLATPASERPTALFAANDAMAVGALAALRAQGLTAPDDLALVGFDDVPLASHLTPALTTVHVPTADLGAAAVNRLHAGSTPTSVQVLPATLVVRASCGASSAHPISPLR